MNDLSWFIYLAGVLPNMQGTIQLFAGIVLFFGTFAFGVSVFFKGTHDYMEASELQRKPVDQVNSVSGKAVLIAAIFTLISTFIPPKDTMYAIAASEMGEELLKTPTASKATEALNAWLDAQIADLNKKEESNE